MSPVPPIRFRTIIIDELTNPATGKPMSSVMVKETAAIEPMNDHIRGIIMTRMGTLLSVQSNIPEVKIVVGHVSRRSGTQGIHDPESD